MDVEGRTKSEYSFGSYEILEVLLTRDMYNMWLSMNRGKSVDEELGKEGESNINSELVSAIIGLTTR